MAYATTPGEIPDAFTGDGVETTMDNCLPLLVEGTPASVESALKAATTGGSLANLAELEQAWIWDSAEENFGFTYYRQRGPVRVTPSHVLAVRRRTTTPVQVDSPPPG